MNPNLTMGDPALAQMTRTAHQHLRQGNHDQFLKIMEHAAAMHPLKHEIAIDIAISFLQRYDYAAAERWFERVVTNTAHKAQGLEVIAYHWRNHNRYEMAERYLERASELPGASANAFAKLGEMYERSRQLDKARESAARALRLEAGNPMALLLSARLERLSDQLEEGEKTLRQFLSRTDAESQPARIRGWYELGANLDRQGRYAEAMAAFVAAKAGPLSQSKPAILEYLRMRKEGYARGMTLLEQTLKARTESPVSSDAESQRVAVICGHPRSGTTLLEQILDSHPQTISAEETVVFHDACIRLKRADSTDSTDSTDRVDRVNFETVTPQAMDSARQWYISTMEKFLGKPVAGHLLIDKNPGLTSQIPQLLRFFSNLKAIVAIRDPRDVCLSCFVQPLPMNPVSCSYLTLADTANEYAGLMAFWLAMKPMLGKIALEIRYEDVVDELEPQAKRALSFLDLEWDPTVLRFDQHARNKLVRSPSYTAVTRPITKTAVGRWRNYEQFFGPAMETLAAFIDSFGYR